MSSGRRWKHLQEDEFSAGNGMDALIRLSLQESLLGESPSPRVWEGIRTRILARRQPVVGEHRAQRKLSGSAPLAQAMVLALVLVVFAVTSDIGYPLPEHTPQEALATTTIDSVSPLGLDLDDVLSGVRLARTAREYSTHDGQLERGAEELSIQDYRLAPFAEYRR